MTAASGWPPAASAAAIREERPGDQDAIREVHQRAFPGPGEARLVDALRTADCAAISLVAERAGRIVGHVLFSRLDAPMPALALAPVGVCPDHQRHGIGSALIRAGLDRVEREGWRAVFVLGDPAWYGRFGFDPEVARRYACPYAGEGFMVRRIGSGWIPRRSPIAYPAPFLALG